ncbi:hypothetical protein WJX72_008816 [[Myrmecia] bisecta]|uniref:RRM domain-containing protein n=1 Tax=[Myrmecia] bisecta TaxID=41462 RepID=A0AAW1R8I5_9CHLO
MSRVYVGNLALGMTEGELESEFVRFGVLKSVWVARKPPGFAFVEFVDDRDADDAIRKLDGYQGWRVERSRPGGGPRHESRPGSYRARRSPSYEPRRRRSPSYDGGRSPRRERSLSPRRSLSR